MIKLFDKIKERSTTRGDGDIVLSGPFSGFGSFASKYEDRDELYYCITDNKDYEIGVGTYRDSRFIRESVISSSQDGNKIKWGPGTREVYPTFPANKNVYTAEDIVEGNYFSFWADTNSISFASGVTLDNADMVLSNLSFGSIATGYNLVCSDHITFLDYESFGQYEPFLENVLQSSTNIDDFVSLSGFSKKDIRFREQQPGTVLSTADSTGYPVFKVLGTNEIPDIYATQVDYIPASGEEWRNKPRNGQEAFDELSNEIYLQLDKFPKTTFADGGNVDTLDFLDFTDFALVDHNHIKLYTDDIVDTEKDFRLATEQVIDQAAVFDDFYRFSHERGKTSFPARPSELAQWQFDNETQTVSSIINSQSFIGFVSNEEYDRYVIETTLRSNAGAAGNSGDNFRDNDQIGMVIAFHKDEFGAEYTLSVLVNREPFSEYMKDGQPYAPGIYISYNFSNGVDPFKILAREEVWWLTEAQLAGLNAGDQSVTPWYLTYPEGIRVRIERERDIIRVYRSNFGDPDNIRTNPGEFLEIDLKDNLETLKFIGPKPYGFCCNSQYDSQFVDISFTDSANAIFNLQDGNVYEYNDDEAEWLPKEDRSFNEFDQFSFVFNPVTKKLFYLFDGKADGVFQPIENLDQIRPSEMGIEIGNYNYLEESDYFYETRSGVMKVDESGMVAFSLPNKSTVYTNPAKIGDSTDLLETDGTEPVGTLPRDMYSFRVVNESGIHVDVNIDGVVKTFKIPGFAE